MKVLSTPIFVLFFVIFGASMASADFYQCGFSAPPMSIYISDSATDAHIMDYYNDANRKSLKVLKSEKKDGVLTYSLAGDQKLEIFFNQSSQNEGDVYFPYKSKLNGVADGSCTRQTSFFEDEDYEDYEIEMLSSRLSTLGTSWVNFWPGEIGSVSGFVALNDVKIEGTSTWASVVKNKKGSLACSIPNGKMIIPLEGERGEEFMTLHPIFEYTANHSEPSYGILQGDSLRLISDAGKGYCLVEKDGEMLYGLCPESKFNLPKKPDVDLGGLAPFGNYVFAKCQEGHFAWIHTGVFEDDEENFKWKFLGL